MKIKFTLSVILLLISYSSIAQNTLIADTNTSLLTWTGHAEIGTYAPSGTLKLQWGSLILQNGEPFAATLKIDMTTMYQKNADLLGHLKSSDFFDVVKYQTSIITITKISDGKAYGKLTIKSTTLPFECSITTTKPNNAITITGNMVIDRTAYGITYNSGSFFSGLGDKAIKNSFEVAFDIKFIKK